MHNTLPKKHLVLSLLALSGAAGLVGLALFFPAPDKRPAIGIIQTLSHPILDIAREGFVDAIRKRYGNTIAFVYHNAQGDVNQAQTIATSMTHDDRIALIFCIATRATQAALKTGTEKPIVFTAVTDSSILQPKNEHARLAGCCDMIDAADYVHTCLDLFPGVRTCAIPYNPADQGSACMVSTMEKALKQRGCRIKRFGVCSEAELPLTFAAACQEADAVLCPIDSTIGVGIEVLAQHALTTHTPAFICTDNLPRLGIAATFSVNYYDLGARSAAQAITLLTQPAGSPPPPIITSNPGILGVHTQTMKALGVEASC